MNNQEIFDTTLTHLRKQRKAAKNWNGDCSYRTEDGLSCAVGCLIPDELYSEDIEGSGMWLVASNIQPSEGSKSQIFADTLRASGIKSSQFGLLKSLQGAHDDTLTSEGLTAWEYRMAEIAKEFDLVYNTPA